MIPGLKKIMIMKIISWCIILIIMASNPKAFPRTGHFELANSAYNTLPEIGMDLRDYIAINLPDIDIFTKKLQEELVGNPMPEPSVSPIGYLNFIAKARAIWRYKQADAMLTEREKT